MPLDEFLDALSFDPALRENLGAAGAGRLLCGANLFEDVVKAVRATNTTWRQAVSCTARTGARGTAGTFPAPEELLAAGGSRLREEVRVGYRPRPCSRPPGPSGTGRSRRPRPTRRSLDGDALAERLTGLAGVGAATAAFLCLHLGHFDRAVVDSATIRHATARWFGGRRALDRACVRGWHGEEGLSI